MYYYVCDDSSKSRTKTKRERLISLSSEKEREREREKERDENEERESVLVLNASLSLSSFRVLNVDPQKRSLCREESFVLLKRSEEEEMLRFFCVCVRAKVSSFSSL